MSVDFEKGLRAVAERWPELTAFGFESPAEENFAANRAELLQSVDEFRLAVTWLSYVPQNARGREDSYTVKHVVEDWCGRYIANGVMIAAAAHAGFRVERQPDDSMNANVGVASPRFWPLGQGAKYDWLRRRYRNQVAVPAPARATG